MIMGSAIGARLVTAWPGNRHEPYTMVPGLGSCSANSGQEMRHMKGFDKSGEGDSDDLVQSHLALHAFVCASCLTLELAFTAGSGLSTGLPFVSPFFPLFRLHSTCVCVWWRMGLRKTGGSLLQVTLRATGALQGTSLFMLDRLILHFRFPCANECSLLLM